MLWVAVGQHFSAPAPRQGEVVDKYNFLERLFEIECTFSCCRENVDRIHFADQGFFCVNALRRNARMGPCLLKCFNLKDSFKIGLDHSTTCLLPANCKSLAAKLKTLRPNCYASICWRRFAEMMRLKFRNIANVKVNRELLGVKRVHSQTISNQTVLSAVREHYKIIISR